MKRLTKAQVELVKKLSTARLICKLTSVGYTDEELDVMDREALCQARSSSKLHICIFAYFVKCHRTPL